MPRPRPAAPRAALLVAAAAATLLALTPAHARPSASALPATSPAPGAEAPAAAAADLAAAASAPRLSIDTGPVAEHPVASGLPDGWQHGAFMEVLVRGYQDSDGDGIGDLRGLTQRLDYLKALGIHGLWLMPVTRSTDHDHGYWVEDFRAIEPQYGTMADFDELVRQAHARGIGIIMDYVINHASHENPLFLASASSTSSPYRDWFVWQDTKPSGWDIFGKDPWTMTPNGAYFGQFGGDIPDFNLRNPAVVNYHIDSLRMWLNHGADGFRIDAVSHLFENGPQAWGQQPENYPFMGWLRAQFKDYGDPYWVCESPGDPYGFGSDKACGAAFAFGLSDAMVKASRDGDPKAVAYIADWWKKAPPLMATMVSNHDHFAGQRLWDAMDGDPVRVRLAAATYLLAPGTPYIYYGEELGMSRTGAADADWQLRGPVSWTADPRTAGFTTGTPYREPSLNAIVNNEAREAHDPHSLLAFYTSMIALRNAHPSIARGDWHAPTVDGPVLSVQRRSAGERTVLVYNYGTQARTAVLPDLPAGHRLGRLWPAGGGTLRADAAGQARVRMAPRSVQVFMIQ